MGVADFEAIVGSAHVRIPPDESLDGVPVQLVVRPGRPEEVARCLQVSARLGAALVASGGGTKLGWGNRSDADGLVRLDLGRLDAIQALDAPEGVATLQAGLGVGTLAGEAAPQGVGARLDSSHAGASVGGSIATDAFGPELLPERRVRDELLGLQVALPNGELTRCGGRVVKNVTGFDLVRLYCGSFGTLGVITEACVRLRPLPTARNVLGLGLPGWGAGLERARELLERAVEPAGAVVVPGERGVELLWRVEGSEADVAVRSRRVAGEARGGADWEAVRRARAAPPEGGRGCVRLSGRPSDLAGMLDAMSRAAGEGALRMLLPAAGIAFVEPAEERLDAVLQTAAERRWGAFVERAPDGWKPGRDVFGAPPEALPLMRELKRRFDPQRTLAPGRFVGGI